MLTPEQVVESVVLQRDLDAARAGVRDDPECTGAGRCHGCLKWCDNCGDVAHVCDTRIRGERCDEHPVPPSANDLRLARQAAEATIRAGRQMMRDGEIALGAVVDGEIARRAYFAQLRAEEDRAFIIAPVTSA